MVGWLARGLVVGGACKCPCCASGCASARASAHAGKRAGSQVLSELARCVPVVRASGACRVRVRVGSVRARACRETTGPGPCGVKRHRLGIGTVDGRSLWTGVWLCGRAEEGQRPVTAHGCSGCPLWQPCAATGRWHDCMIGTSAGAAIAWRPAGIMTPAPNFGGIRILAPKELVGSARIRAKTHGSQRGSQRRNTVKTP